MYLFTDALELLLFHAVYVEICLHPVVNSRKLLKYLHPNALNMFLFHAVCVEICLHICQDK